ncbi:MAG TPA: bifunctional ornithine acetyltransferase/N-acetylglutamate synthase [Anaeromyxobacteraceae bacterium]
MPSTALAFASRAAHRAWLETQARPPEGFRAGTATFEFTPVEAPRPGRMNLALIALEPPTAAFALQFTRNAFPGAPVLVGRRRLAGGRLGALVVNNKISNVGAPGGVEAAERVCAEVARHLGLDADEVLPASTGVIGWRLPVERMAEALPRAVTGLQARSVLPAAEAIMTTDLYPKVRRAEAVEASFNAISVDSDTSTSDTVALLASGRRPRPDPRAFREALRRVCRDLAEDVVRNGEGVHHVVRVRVAGAPDPAAARAVGKAVVNSPLVKTAVAGNDPNVGRLLAAVGKLAGERGIPLDPLRLRLRLGGEALFEGGAMRLDPEKERRLSAHLAGAELYPSRPAGDGLTFKPPLDFPPHERCVELEVDLGLGAGAAEVLGADLTHEYITENADYRS